MNRSLSIAVLAATVAGCAATASPNYDARFGDSLRRLKAQQLHDANAPQRNAQATPRADGRTLRDGMDRHGESYRSPPPTTVINLGVPGGGGAR